MAKLTFCGVRISRFCPTCTIHENLEYVDIAHCNVKQSARGVWLMCVPSRRNFFLNFQVKNAGFFAFVLRKTTCVQKSGLEFSTGNS